MTNTEKTDYDRSGQLKITMEDGEFYIQTQTKGHLLGSILQKTLKECSEQDGEFLAGALVQAIGGHDGARISFSSMESENPTIELNTVEETVAVQDYCELPYSAFLVTFSNARMMQHFHPERLKPRGRKKGSTNNSTPETTSETM